MSKGRPSLYPQLTVRFDGCLSRSTGLSFRFFSIAVFAHYRVSQPRCVRSHHPLVPLPAPFYQRPEKMMIEIHPLRQLLLFLLLYLQTLFNKVHSEEPAIHFLLIYTYMPIKDSTRISIHQLHLEWKFCPVRNVDTGPKFG